jgi:large subunit ribosomal protein L23
MAILNLKKNKEGKEEVKKTRKVAVKSTKALAPVAGAPVVAVASKIIIRPRVTEKATILSQAGREVHVFEVTRAATKHSVAVAIRELYKVTPVKVAILKVPAKNSMVRGRISKGKTGRKAYVYLKAGEEIEVI